MISVVEEILHPPQLKNLSWHKMKHLLDLQSSPSPSNILVGDKRNCCKQPGFGVRPVWIKLQMK